MQVLAKAGVVYAAGTEDMDALTFGTPFLLKRLTFSAGAGGAAAPIQQVLRMRWLDPCC